MEEVSNAKHYIAVNAGGRYPLLKTAQDYTEYFHEALSFSDLYETYRYIEKHGLEKIATVITRMILPHYLRSFILWHMSKQSTSDGPPIQSGRY